MYRPRRPEFSQQQTIDIVTAVVKGIEAYALQKGACLPQDELDAYTDLCCRLVPEALMAAGADLPWIKHIRRN